MAKDEDIPPGAKKYMDNLETVRNIAKYFFQGAQVHSFDPNWRFVYPKWHPQYHATTFGVPDFVLGLIAERLGMPWDWHDEHPFDMQQNQLKYLQQKIEQQEEMGEVMMKGVFMNKHKSGPPERSWFIPLRQAVKCEGSFKPNHVIPHFEEYLTKTEYNEVIGFLNWIIENDKTFGHDLPDVFQEYEDSM